MEVAIEHTQGLWNESVGKSAHNQAWRSEFDPWSPYSRKRESIPVSCHMTSILAPWPNKSINVIIFFKKLIFLHFEPRTWLTMVWKWKELRLGTQLFNNAWIEGKKTVRTKLAWAMQEDLVWKKKSNKQYQWDTWILSQAQVPVSRELGQSLSPPDSGSLLMKQEWCLLPCRMLEVGSRPANNADALALCAPPSFFDKVASESQLLRTSSFLSRGALPRITSYIFRQYQR